MNYRKILSIISAGAVLLSNNILFPAHAEHTPRIVILGDSISTGQSLGTDEKSYVQILEEHTHVEVQNFSKENYTTADILELVNEPEVKKALNYADAIIIAIGEHDMMDDFIDTANQLMKDYGIEEFTDIFTGNSDDFNSVSTEELMFYSNQMTAAIRANQDTTIQNIQTIDSELEEYSDAEIIWMTMYNFLDNIKEYEDLTPKKQSAYDGILNPAKAIITNINAYIHEFAANHENCTVADIYSAFEGNAYQYTNLYQLDLHPNAEGHALIADLLIQEAEIEAIGDVNGDQEINASDAAAVLEHAAKIGSGLDSPLDEEQIKSGDVDGNGSTDSRDASQILIYSAVNATGGSYTFQLAELPDEEEFVDPDPTQPDDEDVELVDPDPTQPDDEDVELVDPDPTQPYVPDETNVNP